ncbi:MAG: TetR/AcrR family transcriptional regulator [Actinomycetota bacterium]
MVEKVKSEDGESQNQGRMTTRRALKREAILDAAAAQLAEGGLATATLDRVGERVGLSKAALYYYVDSRDDLLAALIDRLLAGMRTDAAARAGADASPLEQLRAFLCAHIEQAATLPEGQLVVSNVDALAAAPETARALHDHELVARQLVEAAIAGGELRSIDPLIATTVLFGAGNTLCRVFDSGGPRSLDEMIAATLDLTLGAWAT